MHSQPITDKNLASFEGGMPVPRFKDIRRFKYVPKRTVVPDLLIKMLYEYDTDQRGQERELFIDINT